MPTIAGENITKKAHDAIIKAALAHADEQGYCSEVEEFLDVLGFVIPDQTKTVLIEVTVSGQRINENALLTDYKWNVYHDDAVEVDAFKVSVK